MFEFIASGGIGPGTILAVASEYTRHGSPGNKLCTIGLNKMKSGTGAGWWLLRRVCPCFPSNGGSQRLEKYCRFRAWDAIGRKNKGREWAALNSCYPRTVCSLLHVFVLFQLFEDFGTAVSGCFTRAGSHCGKTPIIRSSCLHAFCDKCSGPVWKERYSQEKQRHQPIPENYRRSECWVIVSRARTAADPIDEKFRDTCTSLLRCRAELSSGSK